MLCMTAVSESCQSQYGPNIAPMMDNSDTENIDNDESALSVTRQQLKQRLLTTAV